MNGGRLLRPRLRQTDTPPEQEAELPLSSDQFQILRTSISGVVNDWRGTAFTRAHYAAAVYHRKSGTTEHNAGKPHGWFVAIGPMEDPQIVVAIVVEEEAGRHRARLRSTSSRRTSTTATAFPPARLLRRLPSR